MTNNVGVCVCACVKGRATAVDNIDANVHHKTHFVELIRY
jgi:hypothetical protein